MPTYTPASLSEFWSATRMVVGAAAGLGGAAVAGAAASGATRAGGVAAGGPPVGAGAQASPTPPASSAISRLGSQVRARGRLPHRGARRAGGLPGRSRGARGAHRPTDDRARRPALPRPHAVSVVNGIPAL